MEGKVVVAFADTLFKADFTLDSDADGIIWVNQIDDPSAFGVVKLDKTYLEDNYKGLNEVIHSNKSREDEIEISQIQLSGRLIQLLPFITKLDPNGEVFYNLKHVETDSESTLLNNSAIRKNTSFSITKRFSLTK